jgi:hypothetical protein
MPSFPKLCLAALLALGLPACTALGPLPGTAEFAASRVSRGFDCGLRVDRARIAARLDRQERTRFVVASSAFAVKAYKAPRPCDAGERADLQRELGHLARR